MDKRISELTEATIIEDVDFFEVLDTSEENPDLKNKKISVVNLRNTLASAPAGYESLSAPVGEFIQSWRAVMIKDGLLYHYDPAILDNYGLLVGISFSNYNTGDGIYVTNGKLAVPGLFDVSFAANDILYASASGILTNIVPAEGIYQEIGFVLPGENIYIHPGQPKLFADLALEYTLAERNKLTELSELRKDPVQSQAVLQAISQALLDNGEDRLVINNNAYYRYNANSTGGTGQLAPDDQAGGLGFWVPVKHTGGHTADEITETATKVFLTPEERTKARLNKGYKTDSTQLNIDHPTAEAGSFARVGSTKTFWLWDSVTSSWINSSSGIANDSISNDKLANMGTNTIKGAITAGDPVDLTPSQVRNMLDIEAQATADQTAEEVRDLLNTLVSPGRLPKTSLEGLIEPKSGNGITVATDGKVNLGGAATTALVEFSEALTLRAVGNREVYIGEGISLGTPSQYSAAIRNSVVVEPGRVEVIGERTTFALNQDGLFISSASDHAAGYFQIRTQNNLADLFGILFKFGAGEVFLDANGLKLLSTFSDADVRNFTTVGYVNQRVDTITSGAGNGLFDPVQDLAAAKAIDTTDPLIWPDKYLLHIENLGLYKHDRDSTATPDDNLVIQPTVGGTRFLKLNSTISSHDALSNILGGAAGEHYHLLLSQYNIVVATELAFTFAHNDKINALPADPATLITESELNASNTFSPIVVTNGNVNVPDSTSHIFDVTATHNALTLSGIGADGQGAVGMGTIIEIATNGLALAVPTSGVEWMDNMRYNAKATKVFLTAIVKTRNPETYYLRASYDLPPEEDLTELVGTDISFARDAKKFYHQNFTTSVTLTYSNPKLGEVRTLRFTGELPTFPGVTLGTHKPGQTNIAVATCLTAGTTPYYMTVIAG